MRENAPMRKIAILAAFAALVALPAQAQNARPNALVELPPKDGAHLTVTTPGWPDGGDIPFENTAYRGNVFPGLAWTAGPRGTQTYAVIMQDTDAMRNGEPILHWTLYNVPASVTKLDPGMAPGAKPEGSAYGPNVRGQEQPYAGPRTPPGPKHHYHLQVFALDTKLAADPAMGFDALITAMRGHVLASGEVVGLGRAP
jgi:para-nitrobenzyl esterase